MHVMALGSAFEDREPRAAPGRILWPRSSTADPATVRRGNHPQGATAAERPSIEDRDVTPDAEAALDKILEETEGIVSHGFGDAIFRAALEYAYEDAAKICEGNSDTEPEHEFREYAERQEEHNLTCADNAEAIRARAKEQLA